MVRGLYTAYTGMANEQKRLDIISNNMANVSTYGYKKESVANEAFKEVLTTKIRDASEAYLDRYIGNMSLGVRAGEVYTDYTQGSVIHTGNSLDIAINGKGFFKLKVKDKNGNESFKYTRNGRFTQLEDGTIVDMNGNHLVNNNNGDIVLPTTARVIRIDKDGSVFADNKYVDTVKIIDIDDYNAIEKYGQNLYTLKEPGNEKPAKFNSIMNGYIEQSNVNVVYEMVNLITITRAYEANQKSIWTADMMLDKAVNQVGKVN